MVPLTVPLFPHAPLYDAATGVNVPACSQVVDWLGQEIVAGPAPVTVTVHVSLIELPHASVPEYVTVMEPSPHPVYAVVIVPLTVPLLPQAPLYVAAAGLNPATCSHVIVSFGQVIVAGPAPVTVTVHVSLIALPHASVPE